MSVILHLSDTHFGTEQPPVVAALLTLAQQQQPDVAVLSGDITQRARSSQFAAARAFVDRLGIAARVVVPGNHDIPLFNLKARIFEPYRRYRQAFGVNLEPEYEDAAMLILGVKTTRRYRRKDGTVSDDQIQRTCERLRRAAPDQLKIVVTHQPVHVIRPIDEENLLRGRDLALQDWARAGADLILGGHIHLPYVRPLRDHHQLSREMWVVQAGTAVSWRVRAKAPNSVNIVRYQPAATRCTAERWDYGADSQTFALAETTELVIDRRRVRADSAGVAAVPVQQ